MPGAASNSIGHFLASRSYGNDTITSNLSISKSTAKTSTFSAVSDTEKKLSTIESKDVISSVPVAKPRSVYKETNREDNSSSPPTYPIAAKNNSESSSAYPIVTVGNGGEDWGTKKRVETKTIKTIETRRQRQLVLEDGRIIEEDEPEVTVDTVYDDESHSDDGEEDRHIIGGFGGSYDPSRALQTTSSTVNGNTQVTPWKPGGNILGEDLKRNTYTTDVQKRSYSTTSATNVGDIKKSDINKIIKMGKNSKTLIRPYDDTDSSGTINLAPKVTHKNSNRKRIVDREDIQEVHRMQDGVVKTDRYVNRECIEDQGEETPEEGDSTDTESHDGDKDSFSQRKEDKFVDYYRTPKGKSAKEGKLVRHGIHLSSHDKSNAKGGVLDDSTMRPAITYRSDDQSDSTATPPRDIWSNNKKPPKPDRRQSASRKNDTYRRSMRYSSSERERESTRSPNNEDFPSHYSTPTTGGTSGKKFHTIERSSQVGRSRQSAEHVFNGNSTIGTGTDQRKPVKNPRGKTNTTDRGARGRSSDAFSDDMTSSYRSRSMSRSKQGTRSVGLESTNTFLQPKLGENTQTNPHHRSMGTIRKDLDAERSGRLKRAMSFSSHDRRPTNKKKPSNDENSTLNDPSPNGNNRSFLGSVKSLYASLRRGSVQSQKKEKENRVSAANRAWFDDGTDSEPKAPPRKTRSQVSSLGGGTGVGNIQRNTRAYSRSSTNIPSSTMENSKIHTSNTTGRRKSGANTSKSFEAKGNRQWDIYSSKPNQTKSPSIVVNKPSDNQAMRPSPSPQPSPTKRQSRQKSPLSFFTEKLGGGSKHQVNESNNNTADPNNIAESAAILARERQNRVDRRRTVSSYETNGSSQNRDPPRFEEDRQNRQRGQVRSRFFGQRDEDDSEAMDPEADEVRRSARPPPDMRRLLLNNINMTRSKSIGNDLDQKQPSVIRAI